MELIIITGITSKITQSIIKHLKINYNNYNYILCSRYYIKNFDFINYIDSSKISNIVVDFSNMQSINKFIQIIHTNYNNYTIKFCILSHAIGEVNKHVKYKNIINTNFNSYVIIINKLYNLLTYNSKILILGSSSVHRLFIKNNEILNVFNDSTNLNENNIYALTKILLDIYFSVLINNHNFNIYIVCPGYNNTKMTEHHSPFLNFIKSSPENSGYCISNILNNNYNSGLYSIIINFILDRNINSFNSYEKNLFYNYVNYKLLDYNFNFKFDTKNLKNINLNLELLYYHLS